MGGSNSKQTVVTPTAVQAPKSQLERSAYVNLQEAERRESELAAQVEQTRQQAEAQLAAMGAQLSGAMGWKRFYQYGGSFLIVAILIIGGILIYDYFAIKSGRSTIILPMPTAQAPPGPSLIDKVKNAVTGSACTGDLLGSTHNAKDSMGIPAVNVPFLSQSATAYGYQWWMRVDDLTTGYGTKKGILTRTDASNKSIVNPEISIAETDNSLLIDISMLSSEDSSTLGSSASLTSEVFRAEVEGIPLQRWFAVAVTVHDKNLEVYVDGKLFKPFAIPGLPIPAVGDISVNSNGGFNGKMCKLTHCPNKLSEADITAFYSAGNPCA